MAKLTKGQIVERLTKVKENYDLSEDVVEMVDYTLKAFEENQRNVTMEDLKDTMSYVEEVTGRSFSDLVKGLEENEADKVQEEKPVVVEEKKIKTLPKKTNTTEEKNEPKAENETKKDTEEKEAPKKDKKKVKPVTHEKVELLATFPETLKSEVLGGSTLKARLDLKTIEDVAKAIDEEQDIVIATYWTKRLLKQYANSYDPFGINPNRPKEFEHDLDLIEITYSNELVVTGCSLYSYVPHIFRPDDFQIDSENGIRYVNGCEFQIYEIIEE